MNRHSEIGRQEAAAGGQAVASGARTRGGHFETELGGRRYQARWAQLGTVEQLRVNVRVQSGTNGSTRVHVETLDLYSPRSRRMFAGKAARVFGCSIDAIEDDLSALLMEIDRLQRETKEAAERAAMPEEEAPEMSAAERKQALALLQRDDLLDQLARDMEALGYVGEETNKRLGYLIAVSRKLPNPLSCIIISQSGAGKSGLASVLQRLAPPEEVVFWSRLTPQALYYVEQDFLKRKLVVIEEREGSDAADYSIRALQSQHKLVQAVPVKDPATGTIRTRTMEVEGPAAFIETTTRLDINPENASRCFELYLDESPTQTARIHQAQRASKTPAGLERAARGKAIEALHHNAQRLLDSLPVGIPYAELLTFPRSWMRTRRDNLRLLHLIEAIAFLHQKRRQRGRTAAGDDYIVATIEDYAIAYSLAADALGFSLEDLRKPVRDLLSVIEVQVQQLAVQRGTQPALVSFTRREVREWSGLPNHQVKRGMSELEELEYVEVQRRGRGSRFAYQLVVDQERQRKPLAGLLSPAELFNRINAAEPNSKRGRRATTRAKVEQSGTRARSSTSARKR